MNETNQTVPSQETLKRIAQGNDGVIDRAEVRKYQRFNFTAKEKLAASIIDQLCPVFMDCTKAYIGPDTFKKLTLRLAELL